MVTSELNPMCKDCHCFNKDCDGTHEQAWTGCIHKEIKSGQKVKITNPYFKDKTGTVIRYLWATMHYVISMDSDKSVLLFRKSEFEII